MINSVVLVGRAGADPTVRNLQGGDKVAEVNIACSRPLKDKKTATDWFTVKLWGKSAEVAETYIKKGHLFGVTGELRQESWEDKDGNKRTKITVHANRLKLMQPKSEGEAPAAEQSTEDVFSGSLDEGMPL